MRKEVIGDAVLYHGDCLDIMKDLEPVDFCFTDPPYGHNNNDGDMIQNWEKIFGGKKEKAEEKRAIANDGKEAEDVFQKSLIEMHRLLRGGGCCCCCCCGGGGGPDPQFARWSLVMDKVMEFKHMVIWDKGPMGMGHHYRRSYETILVGMKKGAACKWYDETKRIENVIRPQEGRVNKIIPGADQHPTEKPSWLPAHFIKLHSAPGDVVLDPFMGSGSTGVACVNLERKFIGIELDEQFFTMACKRIEDAWKNRPTLFS